MMGLILKDIFSMRKYFLKQMLYMLVFDSFRCGPAQHFLYLLHDDHERYDDADLQLFR